MYPGLAGVHDGAHRQQLLLGATDPRHLEGKGSGLQCELMEMYWFQGSILVGIKGSIAIIIVRKNAPNRA